MGFSQSSTHLTLLPRPSPPPPTLGLVSSVLFVSKFANGFLFFSLNLCFYSCLDTWRWWDCQNCLDPTRVWGCSGLYLWRWESVFVGGDCWRYYLFVKNKGFYGFLTLKDFYFTVQIEIDFVFELDCVCWNCFLFH